MAKAYYLPADDAGKVAWLNNLASKLSPYQGPLGLSAADLTSVAADNAFFTYVFNSQKQIAAYSQQWTAFKNSAREGKTANLGTTPVVPSLGATPTTVAPGIFIRITALVARIKVAPGYTESIGQALGIIGADQTVDLNSMKPILTTTHAAGGIIVGWTKQGMSGVEIHVDRGTGFAFLAVDTVPDYTDTTTLPAGQSALWKYKAIYRQNDDRVGQWSDVVSLAVAG